MVDKLIGRNKRRLLVFAKTPILGQVKTRLESVYSSQQALDIHCALLRSCLSMAGQCSVDAIELWVTSEDFEWSNFLSNISFTVPVSLHIQQGDTLGKRMHHAFEDATLRSESLVLIGSDCPSITSGYIDCAFTHLASSDIVLGAAEDGGYVLIALQEVNSVYFQDVSWGSSSVLQQTIKNVTSAQKHYHLLTSLSDIDRPEDLVMLKKQQPQLLNSLGLEKIVG